MRYSHITFPTLKKKQKNDPGNLLRSFFSLEWPKKTSWGKLILAFEMILPVSRVRVIEVCRIKDGYALNNGSIHLQNIAYE